MKNGRIKNLMYQGYVTKNALAKKMHISPIRLQSMLKRRLNEKEQRRIETLIYDLSRL